eukprot:UN02422
MFLLYILSVKHFFIINNPSSFTPFYNVSMCKFNTKTNPILVCNLIVG